MYKLFLCLRYLRSRVIAYFAVLGVMLCVAMMLIVVSVMNGFLRKIEVAAKGLFGDIVIEAASQQGIAGYDAFIEELKQKVPEVEAASPFVLSYGILRVPEWPGYRQAVQVAGIRLPERADVTDFELGLFVQAGVSQPTFDPPIALVQKRLAEDADRIRKIYDRELARAESERAGSDETDGNGFPPETVNLLLRLQDAQSRNALAARRLRRADQHRAERKRMEVLRDKALAEGDDERAEFLDDEVLRLEMLTYAPPDKRVILGLGISRLSFRTGQGEVIRMMTPGRSVILDVFPLGRGISRADLSPARGLFSVCDDCKTGVASIDSRIVYVPFETLQKMNNMDHPARCGQIHLKVGGPPMPETHLRQVARKVRRAWLQFTARVPAAAMMDVSVMTWRERQRDVVASIEAQRTLVVIMFGIISLVSVVLIFVIFYMIVFQKTREIGVLKALGASSGGVAAIFLAYGAVVGLVGAALGTAIGYVFVRNINPIHDWVARTFGLVVWDRKVFMFDLIPNEVQWPEAGAIALAAVVFGIVGALVPAIVAARMQPVEALRYE